MDSVHQVLSIPNDFRWLPTWTEISVSDPLIEIMKPPITPLGVEEVIIFQFLRVVDDHWVRFTRCLACIRGRVLIKSLRVDYVVVLYHLRQI